jgi:hypothetical protein
MGPSPDVRAANTLGACAQCGGTLCVKGDRVACMFCGLPVVNHPLAAAATTPAKNPPVEAAVAPSVTPTPKRGK